MSRDVRQTAYQILVASSLDLLAKGQSDLWNSGKAATDQSIQVEYAGKSLATRQQSFWKVRVWDQNGEQTAWSQPASWTMGILHAADWKALWIKEAEESSPRLPLFRKAFSVAKPLRRAELFICGLGCMEVYLNGAVVDDAVFEPAGALFEDLPLPRLRPHQPPHRRRERGFGVMLGNGMYNVRGGRYTKFTGSFGPFKLLAQLYLDYTDGTGEVVATDQNWLTAPGPITFSCVYGGEDYNAPVLRSLVGTNPVSRGHHPWKAAAVTTGAAQNSSAHPPLARP